MSANAEKKDEAVRAITLTHVPGCCNALRRIPTNKTFKKANQKNNTTQNNFHKESLLLKDHRGFGVTHVRCAVLDQKARIADTESPGAATDLPCGLMHVTLFSHLLVVAAACDIVCVQARASMQERVRSGTQLDGTVVADVAKCCVLPPLLLMQLWLCICCWLLMVVVVVVILVAVFCLSLWLLLVVLM